MQARYYDPVIGRFLSTDPIGYEDQLNLYAYVHNNPVNMIDPNGKAAVACAVPPITAACVQVGALVVKGAVWVGATIAAIWAGNQIFNNDNPVDDLLEGTSEGRKTKGKTKQREKEGTIDDANEDFDSITDPDTVEDKGNGIRVGETQDGDRVVVRPNSSDGRPTVEIQSGKKKIKIRYTKPEGKNGREEASCNKGIKSSGCIG